MTSLQEITNKAFVVCYLENVDKLVDALCEEGFEVNINRQTDNSSTRKYSSIVKCLLNHYSVWKLVVEYNQPAVIVEADFVPIVGFGKLVCPFPPDQREISFGYLYGCGIEVYDIVKGLYARGHSASTVAYYVSPLAARYLCEFVNDFLDNNNPEEYSAWDTRIRKYIQNRGVNSFIPFRNFGEHGGRPNSEHDNVGLNGTHRADVLAGPLHFLPIYSMGNKMIFLRERLQGRCWGIGRLLLGRIIKMHDVRRQQSPFRMVSFVVKRQIDIFSNPAKLNA